MLNRVGGLADSSSQGALGAGHRPESARALCLGVLMAQCPFQMGWKPLPSLACSSCHHLTLPSRGSASWPLGSLGLGWRTKDAQAPGSGEGNGV